jgi:predicted permease
MNTLGDVFLAAVAPIVIMAGIGFVAARTGVITDARPLARASLYVFLPALTFLAVANSSLDVREVATLVFFAWAIAAVLGVTGWAIARGCGFERLTRSAFLISVITVNAGNYGIPLNQFAFGKDSVVRATIYYVATLLVTNTVAIFIAARGSSGVRASLARVFRMPLIYAAVLGLAVNRAQVALPDLAVKPLQLLSNAAVPTMLTLLGVELARVRLAHERSLLGMASVLKLAAAPVFAVALASWMGLEGLTRSVVIVQSSMPTAVGAALISVELDTRPLLVGSAVLVTTLASVVTLTILVTLLR